MNMKMIDYDTHFLNVQRYLKNKGLAKNKEEKATVQKELTDYTNKNIKPLFYKTELLHEIVEEFSTVKLIYNDNKISASKTLAKMYDERFQLLRAQMLLAIHPTRSIFYNDSHAHGVLVPLFMMAHKKYNAVDYEEWDKEDSGIRYVVGLTLWGAIHNWLEKVPDVDDNLLELRESIFESSKRANKTYAGYLSKTGEINHIKVPALTSSIKCQFWLANVANRNEFMILDTVNWDNMPDAFDEPQIVEKAIEEENMYDFSDLDFLKG